MPAVVVVVGVVATRLVSAIASLVGCAPVSLVSLVPGPCFLALGVGWSSCRFRFCRRQNRCCCSFRFELLSCLVSAGGVLHFVASFVIAIVEKGGAVRVQHLVAVLVRFSLRCSCNVSTHSDGSEVLRSRAWIFWISKKISKSWVECVWRWRWSGVGELVAKGFLQMFNDCLVFFGVSNEREQLLELCCCLFSFVDCFVDGIKLAVN